MSIGARIADMLRGAAQERALAENSVLRGELDTARAQLADMTLAHNDWRRIAFQAVDDSNAVRAQLESCATENAALRERVAHLERRRAATRRWTAQARSTISALTAALTGTAWGLPPLSREALTELENAALDRFERRGTPIDGLAMDVQLAAARIERDLWISRCAAGKGLAAAADERDMHAAIETKRAQALALLAQIEALRIELEAQNERVRALLKGEAE